jgi:hypothetical protein
MTTDNFCLRLIQTSQTGGQWFNVTSPFSIPRKSQRSCKGPFEGENSKSEPQAKSGAWRSAVEASGQSWQSRSGWRGSARARG